MLETLAGFGAAVIVQLVSGFIESRRARARREFDRKERRAEWRREDEVRFADERLAKYTEFSVLVEEWQAEYHRARDDTWSTPDRLEDLGREIRRMRHSIELLARSERLVDAAANVISEIQRALQDDESDGATPRIGHALTLFQAEASQTIGRLDPDFFEETART